MSECRKQLVFWLVWLAAVLAVCWWMACVAVGGTRPNNGWLRPGTNVFYFAVTAKAGDQESGFSNEAVFTNRNRVQWLNLAWDKSPSTNVTEYWMHWCMNSRIYTNHSSVGTNLQAWVRLYPPPPSNVVVTVKAMNGGTNLLMALGPNQTWGWLNATNWTATNPVHPMYFRSVGTKGNYVSITHERF